MISTLSFILNDGQSVKAGSDYFEDSQTFDPTKKITRVEVIIGKSETCIQQINFFSGEERLVTVGMDDDYVKKYRRRVEKFEIADDEQLIGCQLDENTSGNFSGVTWLKMKVRF